MAEANDCDHWLDPYQHHSEPETVYCIQHGDELPCPTCLKEDQ
jgi:hypothetical protein